MDCDIYDVSADWRYQSAATERFTHLDRQVLPWSWFTTTCGQPRCLTIDHLVATSPSRIAYPQGVCVYCGMPSDTMDHLLPRAWTGNGGRSSVAMVPACRECNSFLGDRYSYVISERRAAAQRHIRQKYKGYLSARDWTAEGMDELGRGLHSSAEAAQHNKRVTLGRLEWPEDPHYDDRAFQKSGIPDPAALGIL